MTRQRILSSMLIGLLAVGSMSLSTRAAEFEFVNDEKTGELTLKADGQPVFSFVYEDRLPEGVPEEYRVSSYVHLYGLNGERITGEFPEDHLHHRGAFMSWPIMAARGRDDIQLWHPSPLKQKFDQWVSREITEDKATLVAQAAWILNDGTRIGTERTKITAHPAKHGTRAVDLTYTLEAIGGPVQVQGKQNQNKGYGGLTVRTSEAIGNGRLITSQGSLSGDAVQEPFRWADISTEQRGLAVMVHPDHPTFPPPWLLRNSYGGVLNPEYPGLEADTLQPGEPVTLKYRIYIHEGQPGHSQLAHAYQRWLEHMLAQKP